MLTTDDFNIMAIIIKKTLTKENTWQNLAIQMDLFIYSLSRK